MQKTRLMGILNVTPDSFFDGGQFNTLEAAIARGKLLFQQGADLLDIGGESSRPGAVPVSEAEEMERTIPVIQALRSEISIPLSIDTTKSKVAAAALAAGASFLNDISGFCDPEMCEVAVSAQVDICLMHMQGTPQTMQLDPVYEGGIIDVLLRWFDERIKDLQRIGVQEKHIILDPGIGFGKSLDDNREILQNLRRFKALGFPLLLGVSRKSFLSKILKKPTQELLSATLAVNSLAVLEDVDIIRVHDVSEHRDLIDTLSFVRETI